MGFWSLHLALIQILLLFVFLLFAFVLLGFNLAVDELHPLLECLRSHLLLVSTMLGIETICKLLGDMCGKWWMPLVACTCKGVCMILQQKECEWTRPLALTLFSVGSEYLAVHGSGICVNLTTKSFQSERPLLFLGSTHQWQERQGGGKEAFSWIFALASSFAGTRTFFHESWVLDTCWVLREWDQVLITSINDVSVCAWIKC